MDFQQILVQVEAACDDFNVPATRVAAETVLRSFREQPNIHPAALHIVLNSSSTSAKHHAAVAIATSVSRSRQPPNDALQLLESLVMVLCQQPVSDSTPYWVKSVAIAAAAIVKRLYNDQQNLAMSVIQQLCGQEPGTSMLLAALLFSRALIDVMCDGTFSPPIVSFHTLVKQHFQTHTLVQVLLFSLQQLESSAAHLDPGHSASHAHFGLALEVTEKCLSWPFLGDSDVSSDIAATFLPESWAGHIMSPRFVDFLFSLAVHLSRLQYSATLHLHRVFQCIGILCCSPSLAKQLIIQDAQGPGEVAFCTAVVRGLQTLLAALASAFSGPLLNGVCAVLRRLHHHFALDTVLSHVSGLDMFLLSVAQATTGTLAGSRRSEEERTWLEEASSELLGMWSRLLSEAARLQRSNKSLHPDFVSKLSEVASSIAEAFLRNKMSTQEAAESDDDEEDFVGLKDWDIYEDELLDYAVIARFNATMHANVLATLLAQIQGHVTSATEVTIAQMDATHWLLICVGVFLADDLDSELCLVPDLFLAEPAATQVLALCNHLLALAAGIVQKSNVMSPMVTESCWWALTRFFGCYTCIAHEEYDPAFGSTALAVAFQAQVWDDIVQLALSTLAIWHGEQGVVERVGAFAVAASRQKRICTVLAAQPILFPQLVTAVVDGLRHGSFPSSAAPLYLKAIVRVSTHGGNHDLATRVISFICGTFHQMLSLPPKDLMLEENMDRLSRCLEMAGGAVLGLGIGHIDHFIVPLLEIVHTLPQMMESTKRCSTLWLPIFETFASFVQSGAMDFLQDDELLSFVSCFEHLVRDYVSWCMSQNMSHLALASAGDERQWTLLRILDVVAALVEVRGTSNVVSRALSAFSSMLPLLHDSKALQVPTIAIQATQACKSLIVVHQHAFQALAGSLPLAPWQSILSIFEGVLNLAVVQPAVSNALEGLSLIDVSQPQPAVRLSAAQILIPLLLLRKIAQDCTDLLGKAVWAVFKPIPMADASFQDIVTQAVTASGTALPARAQELVQQLLAALASAATFDTFQPHFCSWLIEVKAFQL
ncbi:armadillo-type protein [Catenaria anguillulae PL171]|uniref:Exportin-4 n=1 Tax=Catenaria anguillulae PL171 TaxID=765915 RepID=A0A1Y2H6T6_9FUNG|nr:armadillo-type protein [Catenaria anguillulae PL171]